MSRPANEYGAFIPFRSRANRAAIRWGPATEHRVGGSTWITGTYDPELNLTYWGTGNPGPDMNGDLRPGDNLYTCSLVALDADTGKLKWHFQFTPHDVHDWDAIGDPVLVDLKINGATRKAVVQANRNGHYYALDRTNGKLLFVKPYTEVSWTKEFTAEGPPVLLPGQEPSEEGTRPVPGSAAGITGMRPPTVRAPDFITSVRPTAATCSTAPNSSSWKGSGISSARWIG